MPSRSPVYQCNCRAKRAHTCPQPCIAAPIIDGAVWERVSQVRADPSIIATEVDRRRQDGGLDRKFAAIEKQLSGIADKQTRTARAIAGVDDDAAAAPLLAELKALAAQKAALEQERAALQRRLDDARADAVKVRDLRNWCQQVNQNLGTLSFQKKRLSLEALGLQVRVWRENATDEDGNPRPRWELTMRPTASADSVEYALTSCTAPIWYRRRA